MDGESPSFVEFLDEPVDGSGEEVTVGLPRRPFTRIVLVGMVLVAMAAVGFSRSFLNPSSSGRAATRSMPSAPAPTVYPTVMANSAYALLGPCPAGAQCFVSAPAAAATALRAAFPGAVLETAANVLANRAGHFDPGLLRRVILAERDNQVIQVRIQA